MIGYYIVEAFFGGMMRAESRRVRKVRGRIFGWRRKWVIQTIVNSVVILVVLGGDRDDPSCRSGWKRS